MAVLDLQRKGQQIGRIRIGQQVAVIRDGKDTGKTRPAKLSTFRFTTGSRVSADAIAALYGGEVREWGGEWEVVTAKSAIGVTVPPRDEVVSQWYEMWNKGGAVRRCDSQRETISGGPCQCPHAEDPGNAEEVENAARKRAEMAKLNPPRACKLVTRINVMIPDLPGLGVFRLDTGSYYAAVEIGDSAELMQMARDKGVFLPAILRIDQRQRVAGGQTKTYPVVVLEALTTFRDLATGAIEQGGIAAQLPPAPGQQVKAIAAAPAPAIPAASGPLVAPETVAKDIATAARQATRRSDIERLKAKAEQEGVLDDHVCINEEADEWGELREHLRDLWTKLPRGGEGQ
jgi:hypothetical protein